MSKWLSKTDLCLTLGIPESRLDDLLAAGEFPPARRIRAAFSIGPAASFVGS